MSSRVCTLGLLAALLVGACSDSAGPEVGSVTLSLSAGGAALAADGRIGAFRDVTLTDGASELVLERVALVLREIELERANDDDCLDGDADDDCEEFEVDAMLLELPLDGSVETAVSVAVPPDTYDEIEFDIHTPDSTEDAAFVTANPDFADVSIRVEGTFNGAAFVYVTDLNEEQEIELSPPLVVEGNATVNLTLTLDVDGWFRNGSGTLLDPASANDGGANEGLVIDNIRDSIEVFEDDDRDGEDDS